MASSNKSNKSWIKRHVSDPYVQQSQKDGYPSRAAYKLLFMHEKQTIFKPGMRVLDLGAAPGGWSSVASRLIGRKGQIIAVDLLPMDSLPQVTALQQDCYDESLTDQLQALVPDGFDVVMSDMAPNFTGQRAVDQPRSMALCEHAFALASENLRPGGVFIAKVFQGAGIDEFRRELQGCFKKVQMQKPSASRDSSREQYVLARGFLGYTS